MDIDIPGYTLGKQIGRGGMALVYLAKQHNMDRHVAIKILNPTVEAEQIYAERFLQEAKTVATLNHPHIIPVYDVGQVGRYYYIVMEHLPGSTLSHWISAGLVPEEVLSIVDSIALALYYSHSKGIVHRDIKPENIMFREDHSAVLMDFGIAQSEKVKENLTIDGQMIGTPAYMSPEQARGLKVDHRSDLYSLGIVLYEMLTKKQPFIADDAFAIALKQVTEPVPELPVELAIFQDLLVKLTAKDVDARFQNGLELSKATKQLMGRVAELNSFKVAKKTKSDHVSERVSDTVNELESAINKVDLSVVGLSDDSHEESVLSSSAIPKKNFTVTVSEYRKALFFKRSSVAIDLVSDDIAQFNVQVGQVGERLLQWHDEFGSKAKAVQLQFYCKPWLLEPIQKSVRQMVATKDPYAFLSKADLVVRIYDLSGNILMQMDEL